MDVIFYFVGAVGFEPTAHPGFGWCARFIASLPNIRIKTYPHHHISMLAA